MNFDVIVIGGGHAGMESACASARYGVNTALVTINISNLGEMSCNPAIGGIGKGTIVREIDALDGVMGRFIDKSSIHTKILNSSKGPAVWGLRAQADRKLYHKIAQETVFNYKNLTIIEGMVAEILINDNTITGIVMENGDKILCKSLVIATGTFLKGVIHRGEYIENAGRINEKPSVSLSDSLAKIGIKFGRLKTGTPCRIYRDSIDYSNLEFQSGDIPPMPFSYLTEKIAQEQIVCHITHTNQSTHDIIQNARHRSPMDNGQISSRGPRYCPSIEDKIRRFNTRDRHQIFLEPEGLDSNFVYPNGISTALPADVQDEFIHTISGLENCKIAQFGYAIEYDYIDARNLTKTLAHKDYNGLFFAGQINGTTGYEEAAGQGLVTGVNAALFSLNDDRKFTLGRESSFIGVMIDDLTNFGVNGEPYRMFTSRSEHRLNIRNDNADIRLTQIGIDFQIVCEERINVFNEKLNKIRTLVETLQTKIYNPDELEKFGIFVSKNGIKRNCFDLLSNKNISFVDIERICGNVISYPEDVKFVVNADAKYHFYVKRQQDEIVAMKKNKDITIPVDLDYAKIQSLSTEVIEKLKATRPERISDAIKISGVTPAAVMAIIVFLRSIDKNL